MAFNINNRRYTGCKFKICPWIKKLVLSNCKNAKSFCDIFAGTGVVTASFIDNYEEFYINDFLYSNEVIYKAFFLNDSYDESVLYKFARRYRELDAQNIEDNYVSINYGGKYFSYEDALMIGYIREDLEQNRNLLNEREFSILLTSLIYSFDRCSNTVGHYEAFFKNKQLKSNFSFELINPIINNGDSRKIHIYREDSNNLSYKIQADIVYIDPPYSSRQYSRFYHVIENIVKWEKPELFGIAMKPTPENMSEYCSSKAIDAFNELIVSLNAKYIVVSYNNTYDSKSKSSENKMSIEDITHILKKKGKTTRHSRKYTAFNAGKTDLNNHKEYIFITEVGVYD